MATATATATATSTTEIIAGVVWETRRIAAAHSRHFLALAVLFLLPLSSLLVAAPSLIAASSSNSTFPHSLLRSNLSHHHRPSIAAAIAAAAALLAVSAAAAAAYSTHRGFFGRPVNLIQTLRSLPSSLGRVILTLLASAIPLALLAPVLLAVFRFCPIPIVCFVASAAAALGAIYLQVIWSLATVIAVVELSWGFEPLQRSAHLVNGLQCAVLCLYIFFTISIGLVLWCFSLGGIGVIGGWSKVVPVVARTVFGSAVIAFLLLYCLVANVVMYMYCKALHGELAREIADEFAWEYVCLPFDEQKVPHIVSVVRQ